MLEIVFNKCYSATDHYQLLSSLLKMTELSTSACTANTRMDNQVVEARIFKKIIRSCSVYADQAESKLIMREARRP